MIQPNSCSNIQQKVQYILHTHNGSILFCFGCSCASSSTITAPKDSCYTPYLQIISCGKVVWGYVHSRHIFKNKKLISWFSCVETNVPKAGLKHFCVCTHTSGSMTWFTCLSAGRWGSAVITCSLSLFLIVKSHPVGTDNAMVAFCTLQMHLIINPQYTKDHVIYIYICKLWEVSWWPREGPPWPKSE